MTWPQDDDDGEKTNPIDVNIPGTHQRNATEPTKWNGAYANGDTVFDDNNNINGLTEEQTTYPSEGANGRWSFCCGMSAALGLAQ